MVQGSAGYVIPRFDNTVYSKIELGDHFGHIDLGGNKDLLKSQKSIR